MVRLIEITHTQNLDLEMATTRLGKQVFEGINISKKFDSKKIVEIFPFLLQAGDRIGIVGPNGVREKYITENASKRNSDGFRGNNCRFHC